MSLFNCSANELRIGPLINRLKNCERIPEKKISRNAFLRPDYLQIDFLLDNTSVLRGARGNKGWTTGSESRTGEAWFNLLTPVAE